MNDITIPFQVTHYPEMEMLWHFLIVTLFKIMVDFTGLLEYVDFTDGNNSRKQSTTILGRTIDGSIELNRHTSRILITAEELLFPPDHFYFQYRRYSTENTGKLHFAM